MLRFNKVLQKLIQATADAAASAPDGSGATPAPEMVAAHEEAKARSHMLCDIVLNMSHALDHNNASLLYRTIGMIPTFLFDCMQMPRLPISLRTRACLLMFRRDGESRSCVFPMRSHRLAACCCPPFCLVTVLVVRASAVSAGHHSPEEVVQNPGRSLQQVTLCGVPCALASLTLSTSCW